MLIILYILWYIADIMLFYKWQVFQIILDGKEVTFTAYNIDGSNCFKLRDIGIAADFCVDWDGANNAIVIDTNKGYTPN